MRYFCYPTNLRVENYIFCQIHARVTLDSVTKVDGLTGFADKIFIECKNFCSSLIKLLRTFTEKFLKVKRNVTKVLTSISAHHSLPFYRASIHR